jgi:hypothetical protein
VKQSVSQKVRRLNRAQDVRIQLVPDDLAPKRRGVPVPDDYPLLDETRRYRGVCDEPCRLVGSSGTSKQGYRRILCLYRLPTGQSVPEFFEVIPDPDGDPQYLFQIGKRSKLARRLRQIGASEFTWDVFIGMVLEFTPHTVDRTWPEHGGPPVPRTNRNEDYTRVKKIDQIIKLPDSVSLHGPAHGYSGDCEDPWTDGVEGNGEGIRGNEKENQEQEENTEQSSSVQFSPYQANSSQVSTGGRGQGTGGLAKKPLYHKDPNEEAQDRLDDIEAEIREFKANVRNAREVFPDLPRQPWEKYRTPSVDAPRHDREPGDDDDIPF